MFAKPLRTVNLSQDSKTPYDACPYCLTETSKTEAKGKKRREKAPDEIAVRQEKSSQNQERSGTCKYHFGYLSDEQRKKQIPDECMLCPDVIKCISGKITI